MAIELGEVQGRCGMTWNFLSSVKADRLREGKIRILSQFTAKNNPDLPLDVPSVIDLAANEDDRQVVRLLAAPNEGAQPFLAPPTIPQDRAQILRTAIDATLNDPALKADAQKSGLALDSMNGSELESFIKRVYETPTAVVARAADISRIK